MRNGFTKTLAAAAIACLGYQAFASAPVIANIPSPKVVDDTSPDSTTSNLFVYADFVDLRNYVVDDGDPAAIVWSWTSAAVTERYKFNNAPKLNLGGGDSQITPPAGKVINSAANITAGNEYNPDNNANTPTIRDIIQSPSRGSANVATGLAANSVVGSEVVTLYASDGTTAGQFNIVVTTLERNSNASIVDNVLGGTPTPNSPAQAPRTASFLTVTNGWVTTTPFGPATYSSGTAGICMAVTALGPAGTSGGTIASWESPYGGASGVGGIQLTQNSVWRLRLAMTTTQNTANLVPLWDVVITNLSLDNTQGDFAYAADYDFLDNAGSANAIKGPSASNGLNQFDIWYTPSPVQAPQWTSTSTGAFKPSLDADNDMRITFRVLVAGNAGYLGELDNGTICMTNLVIDRFDLSTISNSVNVYNLNPIVSGINGVSVVDVLGVASGLPGAGSTKDFTTTPLTIGPADPAGWLLELTVITPGDTTNPVPGTGAYGNGSPIVDNYPIPWVSNTLYRVQVGASAPTVGDETRGPDSLLLGFEVPTFEIFGSSYVTSSNFKDPLLSYTGMPKNAASVSPVGPQTYNLFFWSHSSTASGVAETNRIRWKVDVLNTDSFNRPNGTDVRNTGKVTINSVTVSKVTFFGM